MYQFKGEIGNDFRPESGVNVIVKGLDEKILLAPHDIKPFEKSSDSSQLTLTLTPSSGDTADPRTLLVEVQDGTETTTAMPNHWKVDITASSAATPASIKILVTRNLS